MRYVTRMSLAIFLVPAAVTASVNWTFAYRAAEARYVIYGGGLGDATKPTDRDKKISLYIDGSAAQDIFNHIGPDLPDACGADGGTRIREKDGGRISCSFAARDGYRCYVGFDLRTGKSIGGASC